MALFNWNSSYSVKVSAFDKHHQRLIDLINKLHESMGAGKGKEVLIEILEELIEYTNYHFKAEEELMQKYNYTEFVKHRNEHNSFVNKLNELRSSYESNDRYVTIDAYTFLKDWLVNHILSSDKKYSAFFNNQGVI